MRTLKFSKKVKLELTCAALMAIALSMLAAYMNRQSSDYGHYVYTQSMTSQGLEGFSSVRQFVSENIQGELKSGSFETVIDSMKNLTSDYGGRMPYLNMLYENDLWHGDMNCRIPTEVEASFAFAVKQLISAHGKVTHVSIVMTEEETNETAQTEQPLSTVTIALKEIAEGISPVLSQMGVVVPWLVTPLVWVATCLIIILPLSFACLGIVMLFDRGIIPIWKRQFKNKNVAKPNL